MRGLFDINGKLMRLGMKLTNLMWLNILTFFCCIPIFTIGPALTAMHYVLLRIYRDEEGYITRNYFKSFKENFKQATWIWLIYLAVIIVIGLDAWIVIKGGMEIGKFLKYGLIIIGVLGAFSLSWVFVLQSRYENPIKATIKNSFIVSVANLFYTVMMMIMLVVPVFAILINEVLLPVVLLYGFTLPGLLQTVLYSKVFDRMEGIDRKGEETVDDGWSVALEEGTETEESTEEKIEVVQVDEETQE